MYLDTLDIAIVIEIYIELYSTILVQNLHISDLGHVSYTRINQKMKVNFSS